MMKTTIFSNSPEAFISVRKNRVKVYGDSLYLQNGTEFEIEFHNNTPYTQKAEITINGKEQNHALVLSPGEHFYLDRFMDKDKKFKFDVYNVDDNPEVKKIIENNGLVEIKFFKEYVPITWTTTSFQSPYKYWNDYYTSSTVRNSGPVYFGSTMDSFDASTISMQCNAVQETSVPLSKEVKTKGTIETGRVAQGNKSNQQFVEVSKTFESFANTTITYKILPMSQKPVEVTTTNYRQEYRSYCPSCGRRIKRGWVHCAGCGEKI